MGRISDEDVQRVRDATDVVGLISETVMLKQKGRLFWGLCPFHQEKTPSFKVDPATQLWHCFGCGEGGDVFGFLMQTENIEFPDAVRVLADRANIEIQESGTGVPRGRKERLHSICDETAAFYHKTLVSSSETGAANAREYLAKRGFGIETAKRFEVGYAPGRGAAVAYLRKRGYSAEEIVEANVGLSTDTGRLRDRFYERVMFPIRDVNGRAVGFGGRVIGSGEPKYLNTQETPVFHKSRNLYAIERAKNPIVTSKTAVVVEGYTDVVALHEAGVTNVVATLGTALTREHVKLLGRFAPRIVYLFDADEAGLRAAERAVEYIDVSITPTGGRLTELAVAIVPEGKDPADYVAEAGSDGITQVIADAVPLMEFVIERKLSAHDLSSPEGRARALAACASIIATVKGSLLAQDYANYVADKLQTDYTTVTAAVDRARPAFDTAHGQGADHGADPHGGLSESVDMPVGPAERAERALAGLIAGNTQLREKARHLLESGLVNDPVARRIVEVSVSEPGRSGNSIITLLQSSEETADKHVAEVLSGLLMDGVGGEDVESIAYDLVTKLKEFDLQRLIRQRRAQMRDLDPVKDRSAYDELFKEISTLTVRTEKMRSGVSDTDDMEAWG